MAFFASFLPQNVLLLEKGEQNSITNCVNTFIQKSVATQKSEQFSP